ncbi:MAG: hypothetical protein AABX51_04325 [Nanoarchaeota archaeon]
MEQLYLYRFGQPGQQKEFYDLFHEPDAPLRSIIESLVPDGNVLYSSRVWSDKEFEASTRAHFRVCADPRFQQGRHQDQPDYLLRGLAGQIQMHELALKHQSPVAMLGIEIHAVEPSVSDRITNSGRYYGLQPLAIDETYIGRMQETGLTSKRVLGGEFDFKFLRSLLTTARP